MAESAVKRGGFSIRPAWNHCKGSDSDWHSWEQAQLEMLESIRNSTEGSNELLLRIARVLECPNCIDIPNILRRIDANTKPKRRKRK
jgi:hypothetical protein